MTYEKCVLFSNLILQPTNKYDKPLGIAVAEIFTGMPLAKTERLVGAIAMSTGRDDRTLNAIIRTVEKDSLLIKHMRKVIKCKSCELWSLTNRVFCPHCSALSIEDWESKRLVRCVNSCRSSTEDLSRMSPLERCNLFCNHSKRVIYGDNYNILSIEGVFCEYIKRGMIKDMPYVNEEKIGELAELATNLRFHHFLLSINCYTLYKTLGMKQDVLEKIQRYQQSFANNPSVYCIVKVLGLHDHTFTCVSEEYLKYVKQTIGVMNGEQVDPSVLENTETRCGSQGNKRIMSISLIIVGSSHSLHRPVNTRKRRNVRSGHTGELDNDESDYHSEDDLPLQDDHIIYGCRLIAQRSKNQRHVSSSPSQLQPNVNTFIQQFRNFTYTSLISEWNKIEQSYNLKHDSKGMLYILFI